jgi:hypothetical protein
MSTFQMLGWRGLCLGFIFLTAWRLTSKVWRADLTTLGSSTALIVIACQVMNTTLFPMGISIAPVAPVLLGVATVPATLSRDYNPRDMDCHHSGYGGLDVGRD